MTKSLQFVQKYSPFRPQPIDKSPREKEEKQILKNQPLENNRFKSFDKNENDRFKCEKYTVRL